MNVPGTSMAGSVRNFDTFLAFENSRHYTARITTVLNAPPGGAIALKLTIPTTKAYF